MHITINPVSVPLATGIVYGGERALTERDLLKTTRSLGRSLNLYPDSTKYTATTGSLTLEIANPIRAWQGMFELSPRAKVNIYNELGGTLLWSGDGYEFEDIPTQLKCVLKVRDSVERLSGVLLTPPADPSVQVGLRAYLGAQVEEFLGYDLFEDVADDPDFMVFPPEKEIGALQYLEKVLPLLSATHRYFLANDDGRIHAHRIRATNTGVVIREILGDYRIVSGRAQVWNEVEFQTPDREGKFLGVRTSDFTRLPASQAQFEVRKLELDFKHLNATQGAAVAEEVLYTALFPRQRVRLITPATSLIRLLDVVNIDLRTQGASKVRLAGRWVVNELGFDINQESYKLELIQHLLGDPIDA